MRLKYQLRGLGIGIMITAALLMGFSNDEDASAKADNTVVVASTADETTETDITETEAALTTQEEAKTETEAVSNVEESTSEMISEVETENVSEEIQTERPTTEQTDMVETEATEAASSELASNEAVTIKIVGGDDSGTVSRKLQTAGLVDNAREYDAYLMQHGYDKKIAVGTVEIEKGSSWLEIAEKISGR